ncbi:MAG: EAL domain-containing protein [Myxococcales bacterium]|nr:EAL domain-containing protein [Myxococcales bacterium]
MPTLARPRVLVVDDVPAVVRSFERVLESSYDVVGVSDSAAAVRTLGTTDYDAIISDITMPGVNGLDLLKAVREIDSDLPVILVTGDPSVDTAIPAVEYGALSYMIKPVAPDVLRKKLDWAIHLNQLAKMKRQALMLLQSKDGVDRERSRLTHDFELAMAKLYLAYQPIVHWPTRSVWGYEALVRSAEPALPHPGALFDAAERLEQVDVLNRRIRELAPQPVAERLDNELLFLNLHVADLCDETLVDRATPLASIASRVVLEVTERTSLEKVPGVRSRVAELREMGFRIAVDDLGAGYAGLSSFALLEPDVVKLDMTLVRNLHCEPTKQRLVRSMTRLCGEMGMDVIGEGVECAAERDALAELGCDLQQGFFFARPEPPFVAVNW